VFASILDRFPSAPGSPQGGGDGSAWLDRVLRIQFEAGMGMLADGVVWDVSGSADAIDSAIAAWNESADAARALAEAETPGSEPPLVKACLLGPWTSAHRGARGHAMRAAAERIRHAVDALFEAGAPVVQLVEDGLVDLDPDDAKAVRAAHDALLVATRSPTGHVSLSVGGGNVDRLGESFFFDLPVASYAFDLINGPDNWWLIARAPGDRGILCGVADCQTALDDEEAVMIWAARYAAATGERGLERVGLCSSSGLETLSLDAAARKLSGLAGAARKAGLPADELARSIDPRAVDARSGALGRYDPPVRRPR
jgi:hypothetical protein